MPTLARFGKLLIQTYADDHAPPHFHVVTPDDEALIRIDGFEAIAGSIRRRDLAIALEWASANADRLKPNGTASMKNDADRIAVGAPLPRIAGAVPLDGRKIKVLWKSGRTSVVDLAPALASRKVYIPLRTNDDLFRTLRVGEYGNAIEWDGDIGFSALWLSRLPEAEFSNADFRQAMDQLDVTLDGMAAMLDISRRKVADYRSDDPIPKHIAYATRYLVERVTRGGDGRAS
jgi:hypothetical protein